MSGPCRVHVSVGGVGKGEGPLMRRFLFILGTPKDDPGALVGTSDPPLGAGVLDYPLPRVDPETGDRGPHTHRGWTMLLVGF